MPDIIIPKGYIEYQHFSDIQMENYMNAGISPSSIYDSIQNDKIISIYNQIQYINNESNRLKEKTNTLNNCIECLRYLKRIINIDQKDIKDNDKTLIETYRQILTNSKYINANYLTHLMTSDQFTQPLREHINRYKDFIKEKIDSRQGNNMSEKDIQYIKNYKAIGNLNAGVVIQLYGKKLFEYPNNTMVNNTDNDVLITFGNPMINLYMQNIIKFISWVKSDKSQLGTITPDTLNFPSPLGDINIEKHADYIINMIKYINTPSLNKKDVYIFTTNELESILDFSNTYDKDYKISTIGSYVDVINNMISSINSETKKISDSMQVLSRNINEIKDGIYKVTNLNNRLVDNYVSNIR